MGIICECDRCKKRISNEDGTPIMLHNNISVNGEMYIVCQSCYNAFKIFINKYSFEAPDPLMDEKMYYNKNQR